MNISVTCSQCGKHYQVDAKLAGRTVKCKACGTAIKIPSAEDELLEPLEAAAPPPPPPPARTALPAKPAAPKPTPPQPMVDPLDPGPEVNLAPPPLPEPTLTEEGEVITPQANKSMYVRVETIEQQDRDYRGYRINHDYANGTLSTLGNLTMLIGPFLFWIEVGLIMLTIFIFMIILFRATAQRLEHNMPAIPGVVYFALIFAPLAWLGTYVGITSPLTAFAARQAGRILMFDIPEEPRWPMISADTIATCPIILGGLLIILLGLFGHGQTASVLIPSLGVLVLFALPLVLPVHFCLMWLVLRLKFLEMLMAWPLILLAHVITMGSYSVLVILAFQIIKPDGM